MMREEFIAKLREIPGHEDEIIMPEDYAIVEEVYAWHPAIPDVGGKDVIAHLYAYGGMLTMRDMLARAVKAQNINARIAGIRKDIAGMEQKIRDLKAEIYT